MKFRDFEMLELRYFQYSDFTDSIETFVYIHRILRVGTFTIQPMLQSRNLIQSTIEDLPRKLPKRLQFLFKLNLDQQCAIALNSITLEGT